MKKKPSAGERKDGTRKEKLNGKEYEVRTNTQMGADGVIEDHMNFVGPKGTIFHISKELKCRNVMSDEDRKRLGIPLDE